MQTLFNFDIRDYTPDQNRSARPSARAIILPEIDFSLLTAPNPHVSAQTKIALVYSRKFEYFKFPGGGIKNGEDAVTALCREVTEETGLIADTNNIAEYGKVCRLQKSNVIENAVFEQESLYYFVTAQKNADGTLCIAPQNLDDYEKDEGFELQIVTIEHAIKTNQTASSDDDFTNVCFARDMNVLQRLIGVPLEPTVPFAKFLLKRAAAQNPGPWQEHSMAVAECAQKVAAACRKNGYTALNPQNAYIYGLLHDIGRKMGHTYMAHAYDGYTYFMNFGYKNVARICVTHSFNLHDITDYIGKVDIDANQYEELKSILRDTVYDDYDLLIQLLDATAASFTLIDMEARMDDVARRYGYYPEQKRAKNRELKAYFERLMGRDLYEVLKE